MIELRPITKADAWAATALLALQAENERLKDELKNARLMG